MDDSNEGWSIAITEDQNLAQLSSAAVDQFAGALLQSRNSRTLTSFELAGVVNKELASYLAAFIAGQPVKRLKLTTKLEPDILDILTPVLFQLSNVEELIVCGKNSTPDYLELFYLRFSKAPKGFLNSVKKAVLDHPVCNCAKRHPSGGHPANAVPATPELEAAIKFWCQLSPYVKHVSYIGCQLAEFAWKSLIAVFRNENPRKVLDCAEFESVPDYQLSTILNPLAERVNIRELKIRKLVCGPKEFQGRFLVTLPLSFQNVVALHFDFSGGFEYDSIVSIIMKSSTLSHLTTTGGLDPVKAAILQEKMEQKRIDMAKDIIKSAELARQKRRRRYFMLLLVIVLCIYRYFRWES